MTLNAVRLSLLVTTGLVAGGLGSVLGIGGGVFMIPVLVLGFGVPAHVAVAVSLAAVVATSSAAGSVYVGEGMTNMRLGMTLEVATTAGAIVGGLTAAVLPEATLLEIFAGFLVLTAALLARGRTSDDAEVIRTGAGRRGFETVGHLGGAFYDPVRGGLVEYRVARVPFGLGVAFVAGSVSGLLGVGGGFLKVPAMNLGMGVPIKVAAATSNFNDRGHGRGEPRHLPPAGVPLPTDRRAVGAGRHGRRAGRHPVGATGIGGPSGPAARSDAVRGVCSAPASSTGGVACRLSITAGSSGGSCSG